MDAYGCGHEMRKLFKRVLVYLFFYLNILFHNSAIDKKYLHNTFYHRCHRKNALNMQLSNLLILLQSSNFSFLNPWQAFSIQLLHLHIISAFGDQEVSTVTWKNKALSLHSGSDINQGRRCLNTALYCPLEWRWKDSPLLQPSYNIPKLHSKNIITFRNHSVLASAVSRKLCNRFYNY